MGKIRSAVTDRDKAVEEESVEWEMPEGIDSDERESYFVRERARMKKSSTRRDRQPAIGRN